MRALVVTLHTIENEYEECVASIKRQTFRDFEHVVLHNLPRQQAMGELYGTFMQRRDEFDLLIKVDADMVLEHDGVFSHIVERFQNDAALQLLSLSIQDFYTGQRISGLNSYRNTLHWPEGLVDNIRTDAPPLDRRMIVHDNSPIGTQVLHCKNPSLLQALHYGIHRGVKLRAELDRRRFFAIRDLLWFIERTWQRFQAGGDLRLGLAVVGGELGIRGEFGVQNMSYDDPSAEEVLMRYQDQGVAELKREVSKLRRATFGYLPRHCRALALSLAALCGR